MLDVRVALHAVLQEITGDPGFLAALPGDSRKRLLAQKAIYLLRSRFDPGVPWDFNWFITGPHSPALARDLEEAAECAAEVEERARGIQLKPSARDAIARLRALLAPDPAVPELDAARWAQVLASIDCIARLRGVPLDDETLVSQVKAARPDLTETQIAAGIRRLLDLDTAA